MLRVVHIAVMCVLQVSLYRVAMMMRNRIALAAAALAASCFLPGIAGASFILDTGTPTGSGGPVQLLTNDYAVEFAYTAGETITSLAAYVTQGSQEPGASFEFQIFGGTLTRNSQALETTTATYTANGWNSTSSPLNWTLGSTGNYWLVVEPLSGSAGLDLPVETSATTGTVPALGFEVKSGSNWSASTSYIGVEVSAVPLPAALPLLLSGLGGLGVLGRRRRKSA